MRGYWENFGILLAFMVTFRRRVPPVYPPPHHVHVAQVNLINLMYYCVLRYTLILCRFCHSRISALVILQRRLGA